jgi:hypothetical protein
MFIEEILMQNDFIDYYRYLSGKSADCNSAPDQRIAKLPIQYGNNCSGVTNANVTVSHSFDN